MHECRMFLGFMSICGFKVVKLKDKLPVLHTRSPISNYTYQRFIESMANYNNLSQTLFEVC